MKSFVVAAALASIAAANPGLLDNVLSNAGVTNNQQDSNNQGGNSGGLVGDLLGNTGLKADVKLPAGISISAELGPKYPPPAGRTDTWHPAHPGVDMDGCDANDGDWHYVHPCDECQHGHHTWTTSTATNIVTKTVIDCAPTVTDCPARTTAVTTVTTTICPATNTATATPTTVVPVPVTSSSSSVEVTVPATTETPCPETTTVVPPVTTVAPPATTVAPPPQTQTPVWTQTTKAPQPPASVVPPVNGGNNTMTQPPVIVNGGAQAQIGIFAAIAAIVALL
ncbi:hypothetical protein LMH87_002081 [Akanthomyces muscarius]|uniref:Adhesin protein Mad2 n=1 Tax=Akanthomyces muscarius TaxID=2231603 RepID=A0A9W8Q646_AKAMU|nr:hypothetical protein LMH87_002081 [Akanthomyces muscarius]KAJ4147569.1 hypothetical protein LMH87_002081 [Akanthomyces muscarius]